MCVRTRSKKLVTRRRATSGSCEATSAVESTRSTNSAVASLRSMERSLGSAASATGRFTAPGVPHGLPRGLATSIRRDARPEGVQGVRRPRDPSEGDRRGWRVQGRTRVRRALRGRHDRRRPRHAGQLAVDDRRRDRRGCRRRRRRARPRADRHRDALLRRRRALPRRRHRRHRVAQPEGVLGDEDRPGRGAPGRRRFGARRRPTSRGGRVRRGRAAR